MKFQVLTISSRRNTCLISLVLLFICGPPAVDILSRLTGRSKVEYFAILILPAWALAFWVLPKISVQFRVWLLLAIGVALGFLISFQILPLLLLELLPPPLAFSLPAFLFFLMLSPVEKLVARNDDKPNSREHARAIWLLSAITFASIVGFIVALGKE
jgi:hypothetical protein